MAFIRKIEPADAEGELAAIYDASSRRAGKVYEILKISSLRPDILKAWLSYYLATMCGASGLTRVERELVATVVSRTNGCHY